MESDPIVRNYITCQEAADYIGVHVNFLYLHKEIPHVRIGRKILYRKSAIDEYLAGLEKGGRQNAENN